MCCMLDASIHFLRIMEYVRLQEVWRYSYPLKVQPLRAHAWDLPMYRCAAHACCHSLTVCMLPRSGCQHSQVLLHVCNGQRGTCDHRGDAVELLHLPAGPTTATELCRCFALSLCILTRMHAPACPADQHGALVERARHLDVRPRRRAGGLLPAEPRAPDAPGGPQHAARLPGVRGGHRTGHKPGQAQRAPLAERLLAASLCVMILVAWCAFSRLQGRMVMGTPAAGRSGRGAKQVPHDPAHCKTQAVRQLD